MMIQSLILLLCSSTTSLKRLQMTRRSRELVMRMISAIISSVVKETNKKRVHAAKGKAKKS